MLKLVEASDPKAKFETLKDFDPFAETWVTADLNSKAYVQSELLGRYACVPEDAAIRISELWKKLIHRHFCEVELISTQLAQVLLSEWLQKRGLEWARHPGTPRILLQYIGAFLPVLANEKNMELMREWLRQGPNVSALLRWGNWFELSVEAWDFLSKEKILIASWAGAYLAAHDWPSQVWPRRLHVDVGGDLTGLEVDLLRRLAEETEVRVYAPSAFWIKKYGTTLWPYQILAEANPPKNHPDLSSHGERASVRVQRFTTQIAEVKAAVSFVREKLEAGASPHKIALLAANMEEYWLPLSAYLKKEGVPAAKNSVCCAGSLTSVSKWFSRLAVEARDLDRGVLEQSVFAAEAPIMDFERYRQLFSSIYDEQDLSRDVRIKKLFEFRFAKNERISRDQFFAWAIRFWSGDPTGLEKISSDFLRECPPGVRLELGSWMIYLSGLVAKTEIQTEMGEPNGLICSNLDAAQNLQIDHAFFLGLSESALCEEGDVSLSPADVRKLATDLGIYLESPDRSYNEFLADQMASMVSGDLVLSFAATDFSGQAQAPSLLWLQKALDGKVPMDRYTVPSPSRWDEIQGGGFSQMSNREIEVDVLRDCGLVEPETFSSPRKIEFSPSQVERYLECPFLFSAEKLFHLRQNAEVDLDTDRRTQGQLMHALLEELLREPLRWQRSDAELIQLVDQLRQGLAILVGDERLWPVQRESYLRMAKNFLNFEKEWRERFPLTKTVARELRVSGSMNLGEGLSAEVSGKIDRVDVAGEECVVLDYKSTAGKTRHHGAWLKNDELQLAFYSLAIEEGLTALGELPVVGALYFIQSKMDRNKGARVIGRGQNLFDQDSPGRGAFLSEEEWGDLKIQVKKKIAQVVRATHEGQFAPQPKDVDDCKLCDWRTLCRAPHLN